MTYVGPSITDWDILPRLPQPLRTLLETANGYVAYNGGLHLRGACTEPRWHSLRCAWEGGDSLHELYPVLSASDVPFAEDALGDQYIVRDDEVYRLAGETGALEALGLDLVAFDAAVRHDPVGYLQLQPLEHFRTEGGTLAPGQLLSVYPPYCAAAEGHRSMRAVDALERRHFLASLASQLRRLPDGARIRFVIDEATG